MNPTEPANATVADDVVDVVCDEFEMRLAKGERPAIEDFLSRVPPAARPTLIVELVGLEIDYRSRRGEGVGPEEYLDRFPEAAGAIRSLDFESAAVQTTSFVRSIDDTATSEPGGAVESGSIDEFELVEPIGEGAFGIVWAARDGRLNRPVAVKLPRAQSSDSEGLGDFLREARSQARLEHENVVRIYRVGSPQSPYIVSELCEGGSLREQLAEPGSRPTPRAAAELCLALAKALEHAHSKGTVHRDLKPANVLLDAHGTPKLTDFGLAKQLTGAIDATHSNVIKGSPAYMSPEQAGGRSREVDGRSDVYALGVLLYEMLAGCVPFQGEVATVLQKIVHEEPLPPTQMRRRVEQRRRSRGSDSSSGGSRRPASVPGDLETICLRAMAKEPRNRYQTAGELAADLRRFLDHEPIHARRAGLPERCWRWMRRNPAWTVTVLVVVLSAAVLGLVATRPTGPRMPVVIETEPAGAKVVLVPWNLHEGRARPDEMIRPSGRTPLRVHVPPRDYLVVAVLEDTEPVRFHEVYRHVPENPEALPGAFGHQFWSWRDGWVHLPKITIPEADVADGMARVPGTEGVSLSTGRCAVPAFHVDTHEATRAEYEQYAKALPNDTRFPRGLPPDHALTIPHTYAVEFAEAHGKRLPTEQEFEYLATNRGTTRYPWGDEHREYHRPTDDFGPVGEPAFDRLPLDRPVFGLCSNVAEWTMTGLGAIQVRGDDGAESFDLAEWGGTGFQFIVRGGNAEVIRGNPGVSASLRQPPQRTSMKRWAIETGLGFRCVRSAEPRLKAEDFQSEVGSPPSHREHESASSH